MITHYQKPKLPGTLDRVKIWTEARKRVEKEWEPWQPVRHHWRGVGGSSNVHRVCVEAKAIKK